MTRGKKLRRMTHEKDNQLVPLTVRVIYSSKVFQYRFKILLIIFTTVWSPRLKILKTIKPLQLTSLTIDHGFHCNDRKYTPTTQLGAIQITRQRFNSFSKTSSHMLHSNIKQQHHIFPPTDVSGLK